MDYTEINSETIDRWVEGGWEWGVPITREAYARAKSGEWEMLLTPTKPVPKHWFPNLSGARVLGLASGGAQQMPIFAAQGAACTVLDYSKRQLESESMVAAREGYEIEIVHADMTKPLPFENESFDLIFHPVSNCYIEEVEPVWRECYRILKPGGRLMAGLDNGYNFIVEDFTARPMVISGKLPFNPLKNPEQMAILQKDDSGVQFSHTLEEQIGGQLKAGFILTDVYEDFHNDSDAIADGIPAYWATLAVKPFIEGDRVYIKRDFA